MKKIITSALTFMLLSLTAGAQEKKSWDFTQGLSDETIANLNADTQNWASNGTDADGATNNWKNAVKQSADGYWMANGQVIEELRGLKIDIGSNKDNSVHLATTKLRLTRKGTKITFPRLANGQKITIVGRSANSSATNRGIAPVQSYIQFQADESSPQTNGACVFLGNTVEGSEGTYTFVWKVVTEGTDSVDVQFQLTPDAGIDFNSFTIDQGDAPATEEAKKVVYLGAEGDVALGMFDASVVDAAVVETVPALADLLENYDALVVGTSASAEQLQAVKDVIAFFPVVNTNPALYALYDVSTGEAEELTITETANAIFDEKEEIAHTAGITAVNLSGYFANDLVLATAGEAAAIHVHNAKRNAYYYIPLAADEGEMDLYEILSNTIVAAAKTKKGLTAVAKPSISFEKANGVSIVTISAQNSTAIYYTIDGTEPTTSSPVYSEPFELTTAATVKAFAVGDGYSDSEIASKDVTIATQLAAPVITVTREQGKSLVAITGEEGASLFFNFNGAKTAALSQAYTEPIELTEPAVIYALSTAEGSLPSELTSQFVGIDGVNASNIRLDVLSHFDANETDWFINDTENGGEGKVSAYYFWGKNAWNYYSSEVDHEEIVKASDGVTDSTVYVYKPNAEALRIVNPLNENGWVLKSQGQVFTGELQLAPEAGVGNGVAGRFAEEATDLMPAGISNGITKGVITFGAKISGEPYTGSIESTVKYAGPFDVVVFCGNGNSGGKGVLEIQVSADGDNWTSLGELKLADTQRYFKRTKVSYEDAAEVYVRIAQTGGGTKAQVYDVYLLNNGEQSKAYTEETVGISNVQSTVVRTSAVYNLNGMRQQSLKKGLNIVIEDGIAKKIMLK